MAYLIDSNVFIAAKNLHYGLDFCPAFWDWLVEAHRVGIVFSIEKVNDELAAVDDELSRWVEGLAEGCFLKPKASTLPALTAVATWIESQPNFSPAAKNTFLQIADYYLIAQALAGRHVVVTHERPSNSVNIIKIPSACLGVGVEYRTPFDMLRRERVRFILGA